VRRAGKERTSKSKPAEKSARESEKSASLFGEDHAEPVFKGAKVAMQGYTLCNLAYLLHQTF
jgi:hypothetical protein